MALSSDPAHLIRSAGRKVTNARLTVAEVLRGSETHMTAPEVVDNVEGAGVYVDKSTVYRVLADLRDVGLVAESRFGAGEANYEWIADSNHHHLFCSACRETFSLDEDLIDRIMKEVYDTYGFSADLNHTVLAGTCRPCSDEEEPAE